MNPYFHSQQPTPPEPSASLIKRFGLAGVLLLLLLALTLWCSPPPRGGQRPTPAPARRLASHHSRETLSTELDRVLADARTAAAMLRYLLEPESPLAKNHIAVSNASWPQTSKHSG